jgi:hypothetical protein
LRPRRGLRIGVVRAAARPNAGKLVDALHLARTGGVPADVLTAPAGLIRSAQLCDAFAKGNCYLIRVAQSPQVANMPMAATAITAVASQPKALSTGRNTN